MARVAKVFGMDPVAVLLGPEMYVHLRIAALQVINRDEKEAAKKK